MRLLTIKDNKPYGNRHGEYYYRDYCLFYFDCFNGKRHQVLINDEAWLCSKTVEVRNHFLNIKEKRLEQTKSNIVKTVIWCNKLGAALPFWKQFGEWEEKWYEAKQAREKSLWSLTNDMFEIRNFDLICNTDDLEKLKTSYCLESNSEVGTMRAFLKMREEQGLRGWAQINFSFSYCELKVLYSGIKKEDVPASHWTMIPNLSVYRDLQRGIQHGVLANHSNLERLWWKNCIESWDLSSAYPSKLVNMKMPMGKFIRLEEDEITPDILIKLRESEKYYYIRANFNKRLRVIDCPIFNGNDCEEIDGRFYYTLTNFDLEAMKLWGFDFAGNDFKVSIIRVAEFKDYIWKPVRQRIYERWVEKQENKKTNYAAYFRAKTAIDAIWGKSIQEFNPKDNRKISNRFRKIDHFILPQWGLWTCAAIRLEMIKVIVSLEKHEFIAGDTDGIKTLGDRSDLFEERNRIIKKANEEAGFPSDIGTWHYEGCFDNYMFLKSKFYAYSINGELVCKFAGCNNWKSFFKDKTIDEVFEFLEENDVPIYNTGVMILPKGILKAKLKRNEDGTFKMEGLENDIT